MEEWELIVNENNLIVKNSVATTTLYFADFKKYKKDNDSITFYFNGMRCFYINWKCKFSYSWIFR